MAERFYLNWPLAPGPILLDGPEAHHLATVSRLHPGDRVYLFNGDGQEYLAEVISVQKRSVGLEILRSEGPERELPYRLEVAAPLPKGDRAQFLVEKLTEIGATAFVPLQTRRSVVHPREAKLDKLQRYVVEASKQCRRNILMQVQPLCDWEEYCGRDGLPALRVLAHPTGQEALAPMGKDAAIAVGPEGGFTDEEVTLAREKGWQVLSLGPRILRIETAALVLAARYGEPIT